ncbi:GDSL-like Lipase/Acylhydrolase-domain-containing protein [Umbelopsis sp. AD052]|nr:GDSL-like Lipase/Acylhydrolase-domain-containing protein [Umbelopsis sp. AD052]
MFILGAILLAPLVSAIQNLVVFGDSYSDIGNNGIYTDNANWAQDLAYSWNASLYDFAYGGATCDNHIEQYVDAVSVSQQVADYISRGEGKNINASESVYAIFVGINDANLFNASNTQAVANCVAQQMKKLEQAYGAQDFLIFNIPPMQYSPFAKTAIQNYQDAKADWIANYNQLLNASVHNLGGTGSLVFFDTYDLFKTVLANPTAYGFDNTVDYWNKNACTNITYCPENVGGIPGASKFLWWDGTHVTSAMHKIIANSIIALRPFGIQGNNIQNQYQVNRTALPISQGVSGGITIDYWMLLMLCMTVAIQTHLFM